MIYDPYRRALDPYPAGLRQMIETQRLFESQIRVPDQFFSLNETLARINMPLQIPVNDTLARISAPLQDALASLQRQNDEIHHWHDQWTRQFGPGTVAGDLFLARRGDEDASSRLAERLMNRWKPSPEAKRILIQEADEQGSTLVRQKQLAIQRAVILVTQYMTQQVSVRVGQKTIRNEDGTVWLIRPGDTHIDWYWWWVGHEVPIAAEADVCGKEYPASHRRTSDALGKAEPLPDEMEFADDIEAARNVIDALVEEMGAIGEVREILAEATERECRLIEALRSTESVAEAERLIGINEGAGRQTLFRLRKRMLRSA